MSQAWSDAPDMAAKFETILFNKWLLEKKTADDVFNFSLKRYHQSSFWSHSNMSMWVSFVKAVDKEDPFNTMLCCRNN